MTTVKKWYHIAQTEKDSNGRLVHVGALVRAESISFAMREMRDRAEACDQIVLAQSVRRVFNS